MKKTPQERGGVVLDNAFLVHLNMDVANRAQETWPTVWPLVSGVPKHPQWRISALHCRKA